MVCTQVVNHLSVPCGLTFQTFITCLLYFRSKRRTNQGCMGDDFLAAFQGSSAYARIRVKSDAMRCGSKNLGTVLLKQFHRKRLRLLRLSVKNVSGFPCGILKDCTRHDWPETCIRKAYLGVRMVFETWFPCIGSHRKPVCTQEVLIFYFLSKGAVKGCSEAPSLRPASCIVSPWLPDGGDSGNSHLTSRVTWPHGQMCYTDEGFP